MCLVQGVINDRMCNKYYSTSHCITNVEENFLIQTIFPYTIHVNAFIYICVLLLLIAFGLPTFNISHC